MINKNVGTLNEIKRFEWVIDKLKRIPSGKKILDAGAGKMKYKPYCSHLEYVSQDFGKYDGMGDGKGLQTNVRDNTKIDIISDIIKIPRKSKSFDAVMCIEVLEHLPEPLLALKELARLIIKGGDLILTAPFCSLTHLSPYHFTTGFNRYFYEYHMKKLGFEIIEITENGNFFEFLAQEVRRIPYCLQKYCSEITTDEDNNLIDEILIMLQRFAEKDHSSQELLCFGYHILAKKI